MVPNPVKVVVTGAQGRMGRAMIEGLAAEPDVDLAGAIDRKATEEFIDLPRGGGLVPVGRELEPIIRRVRPRVVLDFTVREAAMDYARTALRTGVSPVIGTTGLTRDDLGELDRLAQQASLGVVVAPNFAVGANLMMHFARVASRFMPAAEIVELHHDGKLDAPSGTALATARAMHEARGDALRDAAVSKFTLEGVRGGVEGGVRIHSVRLPGLVAHQEVIFGGLGQTLSIRHDSMSRESFVSGVVLAVKAVVGLTGLVVGLDNIMGLE
jgi:4-hydroxy-tetrahydrodipicolinate reductase